MSQYKWNFDKYEFIAGCDRPLQYFFLMVDHKDPSLQEDVPVFTNLNLPSGPGMTIEEIKGTCLLFGSALPDAIIASMLKDKEAEPMDPIGMAAKIFNEDN